MQDLCIHTAIVHLQAIAQQMHGIILISGVMGDGKMDFN